MDTHELAWKRTPIKCYFSSQSKSSPCLPVKDCAFWNTLDYHNRLYERFIGPMSSCLSEVMVKDFQKKPTGEASGHQNSTCASRYNDPYNYLIYLLSAISMHLRLNAVVTLFENKRSRKTDTRKPAVLKRLV